MQQILDTLRQEEKEGEERNWEDPYGFENWLSRKEWPAMPADGESRRIADLFCGCGGLTLGVREALRVAGYGMEVAFAVDQEEEALGVYRENFGVDETVARNVDILELVDGKLDEPPTEREAALLEEVGNVDILVGGPPCQGNSDLNNHSRRDDARNSLYLRAIRFAELFSPQIILIENVPGVVHAKQDVVATSRYFLEKLDYRCSTLRVHAFELGVPQTRVRHFLVAMKSEFSVGDITNFRGERTTLRDSIWDIRNEWKDGEGIFQTPSRMQSVNQERASYFAENPDEYDLPDSRRPACHRDGNHSYKSVYGRLDWDKPAQTITTGFGSMGQGRFLHPDTDRQTVITPHEAARLQSFPDFFDFSSSTRRTRLHAMIGNAVPPKAAAMVFLNLLKCSR